MKHLYYTHRALITPALALAVLASAPVVYAQVGTNATLESNFDAQASTTNTQANLEGDTSLDTAASASSSDSQRESNGSLESSLDTTAEADMFGNTNGSMDANGQAGANRVAKITIDGQTIDADVYAGQGSEISGDINSNEELAVYAQLLADTNSNIERIDSSDQSVTITYTEEARFLGMNVDSSRTAHITVDENGVMNIEVSKPWWSIFLSGDTASNADIKAEIQDQLSMQAMNNAELDWNTQAQIISAVETAMRIHVDANAQATASL